MSDPGVIGVQVQDNSVVGVEVTNGPGVIQVQVPGPQGPAGQDGADGTGGRELLTAARTYYVRTTGSDSNDGLTSGNAFLTIQKAVDTAVMLDWGLNGDALFASGFQVTVDVGAGTFAGFSLQGPLLNQGIKLLVQGAGTSSTIIDPALNGYGAYCYAGYLYVKDICFDPSGSVSGWYVFVDQLGYIKLTGCKIVAQSADVCLLSEAGGWMTIRDGLEIDGDADIVCHCIAGGNMSLGGTITLTGTPAWGTAFAVVEEHSTLIGTDVFQSSSPVSFSGSATGKRFIVRQNGLIKMPPGQQCPGDTDGTFDSGGTQVPGNAHFEAIVNSVQDHGDSHGWNGYTVRQVIDAADLLGPLNDVTQVRLTFQRFAESAPNDEGTHFAKVYIGIQASSGDAYDFAATPVPITVASSASFTLTNGQTGVVSDWATLAIAPGDSLVLSYYFDDSSNDNLGYSYTDIWSTATKAYYKAAVDDTTTVNATGYTLYDSGILLGVIKIETRATQTPWASDIDANGFNLLFDDATGIEDSVGTPYLLFDQVASGEAWFQIRQGAASNNWLPAFVADGTTPPYGMAFVPGSGLAFPTASIEFQLGTGDFPFVLFEGTSTGSGGPYFELFHNSASPAVNDYPGTIAFPGKNSVGTKTYYGQIYVRIDNKDNGTESAHFELQNLTNGSAVTELVTGNGVRLDISTTAPGSGNLAFANDKGIYWGDQSVSLTGDSAAGASGQHITFNLGSDNYAGVTFESTSVADGGPFFEVYQNSASPASGDFPGTVVFAGNNSLGAKKNYAYQSAQILDKNSGSEDGEWAVFTITAGASDQQQISIGDGVIVGDRFGLGISYPGKSNLAFADDKGIYWGDGSTNLIGSDIAITGVGGWDDVVNFNMDAAFGTTAWISTSAGAYGPHFVAFHDSASPAVDDAPLGFYAYGRNDAAAETFYGAFYYSINSITAGNEESMLSFTTVTGGTQAWQMRIADGVSVGANDLAPGQGNLAFADAKGIFDGAGNEQLIFQQTASAVNYWEMTNAATTDWPILAPNGSDTDIGLTITVKGSPAYQFAPPLPDVAAVRVELGAASNFAGVILHSTDDTNKAPNFGIYYDRANPANGDYLGYISWYGNNDAGEGYYGPYIYGNVSNIANGFETTYLGIATSVSGSAGGRMGVGNGVFIGDPTFATFPGLGNLAFADAKGIYDGAGNPELIFQQTASAVNYLEITNAATGVAPSLTPAGDVAGMSFGANFVQLTEMSAPAAGAANTVRLYAKDDGSGNTQLCAKGSGGTEVVICTL